MFYVFHGDDTHTQQKTLANLIGRLGDPAMIDLNTTRFEGQVNLSDLRHACDTIPFLAKIRLVIVQDAFGKKADKAFVDGLKAYLPTVPESTRLVFLESQALGSKHPLLQIAADVENAYVKQFDRPEGQALDRWIRQQAEAREATISRGAAAMLAANIGNDLALLSNELDKLVLYKGDDPEPIDEKDVSLLCPYVAETSIFDLVDALGNRNGRVAARLLQAKMNEGTDPFFLFSMVVRQFRLLIQVKELAVAGQRGPAIAKELRLHSYVSGKLHQQSQHFSLPQLERIYAFLLETDVKVKTGRTDMTTALHLLVSALTA